MAAMKKTMSLKKISTAKKGTPPKVAKRSNVQSRARKKNAPTVVLSGSAASNADATGLRVRMFRVGFGDFFLLTVPTSGGPKHILIDCGVFAGDLGSIEDAVAQMAKDCDSQLALLVMTHRHADHISGFARCRNIFSEFTVEQVWMSWFEDPHNTTATAFQASLMAMAGLIGNRLALRSDSASQQFAAMAANITGDMAVGGGSSNQVALDVLHNGFKNKPAYNYYQAGMAPQLPDDLLKAGLSAQILGPPIDLSLVSQLTYKNQQYLSANVQSDHDQVRPFPDVFRIGSSGYPKAAFKVYKSYEIKEMVARAQPDVLAAQAIHGDNTLNNQSLVILFTFRGKNLLFAGDAQWGNWENFLYGGAYGTPGHTELTTKAKTILGELDFYKVGHHGSTNATPKDAVAAMRHGCVGMCSTQPGAYNEVPRSPLLQALSDKMDGQLARSDQISANKTTPPTLDAGPLPSKFTDPAGMLFVDYEF
jgi:beta-lactamase superfamily II metal-dependent hydrolase